MDAELLLKVFFFKCIQDLLIKQCFFFFFTDLLRIVHGARPERIERIERSKMFIDPLIVESKREMNPSKKNLKRRSLDKRPNQRSAERYGGTSTEMSKKRAIIDGIVATTTVTSAWMIPSSVAVRASKTTTMHLVKIKMM